MSERRMYGSVRGLRREPLVYSTVGKKKTGIWRKIIWLILLLMCLQRLLISFLLFG